jgi:hypothetical protein
MRKMHFVANKMEISSAPDSLVWFGPEDNPMKLAYCIAVLIALAPCAALAAPPAAPKEAASKETVARDKDCSTIKSITVRQACLDRQAAERPGQTQQDNLGDAVDKMKREDDLLAKKLKSICRGC